MSAAVKLKGFKELEDIFEKLPLEVARGAGNDGIRAGAKIVLEEAKRRVPVKTGKLRDSLYIKKVRATKPVYKVIAKRPEGSHAWLVELGTKPHDIHNVNFKGKFYPVVHHPGAKKQPFLRPALLDKQGAVVAEVRNRIVKSITKRLKKFLK